MHLLSRSIRDDRIEDTAHIGREFLVHLVFEILYRRQVPRHIQPGFPRHTQPGFRRQRGPDPGSGVRSASAASGSSPGSLAKIGAAMGQYQWREQDTQGHRN